MRRDEEAILVPVIKKQIRERELVDALATKDIPRLENAIKEAAAVGVVQNMKEAKEKLEELMYRIYLLFESYDVSSCFTS